MTTSSLDPPGACRILALDCLTCPLLCCIDEVRQPVNENDSNGTPNKLFVRWQARWTEAKVAYVGKRAFVAETNRWLMETVLPEARKVLRGESAVLGAELAGSLVEILG